MPVRDLTADDWSGDAHADVLAVDVAGYLWYYPAQRQRAVGARLARRRLGLVQARHGGRLQWRRARRRARRR